MWFPIEGLSGGFLRLMEALPFKNVSVLLQRVAMPNGADGEAIGIPMLILLAYTVLSLVLSCVFFVRNAKVK